MEKDEQKAPVTLEGPQQTSWKLYLGGIPVSLSEEELSKIFNAEIDQFVLTIMKNPEQGNSKGCGFIEVFSKQDFKKLMKAKIEIGGQSLQIEEYISNEEERKKKMFENNEKSIHVGGLPLEASKEDLEEYFSQFGKITRAYIIFSLGQEKKSRGFGFLQFSSKKTAKKVLKMTHKILDKEITVSQRHTKREIKTGKHKDSTKAASITGSSLSSKSKAMKKSKKGIFNKLENQVPVTAFTKVQHPLSASSLGKSGSYYQKQQSLDDNHQSIHSGSSKGKGKQQGRFGDVWGYNSSENLPLRMAPQLNPHIDDQMMHYQQSQGQFYPQGWQSDGNLGVYNYAYQGYYNAPYHLEAPGYYSPNLEKTYDQQTHIFNNQYVSKPEIYYPPDQIQKSSHSMIHGTYIPFGQSLGVSHGHYSEHTVKSHPVKTSKAAAFTFDAQKHFNPFSKQGRATQQESIKGDFNLMPGHSFDLKANLTQTKVPTSRAQPVNEESGVGGNQTANNKKPDDIAQNLYKLIESSDEDK